jgi:hypothetical protein
MEVIKGYQKRPDMHHRFEQFLQEVQNIEVLPFGEQGAHGRI